MAIRYEKLNTSAARGRRLAKKEIPADRISVVAAGTLIWDPLYGRGRVIEPFVADSDNVKCEFESGNVVTFKGFAVRRAINDRKIQDSK